MSKKKSERYVERKERAAQALRQQKAAERQRKMLAIGGVVVVIALIIGVGFWIQSQRDTSGEKATAVPTVAQNPSATDETPVEVKDYGIILGDPAAPKTVTVYEDLQCPGCANFEALAGDTLNEAVAAGDIRLEYRMVGILDYQSTNDYSSRALNAALVVLDTTGIEAFRTFHDDLFATQPAEGGAGFEDDELITRAVAAGADEEKIRKPIEDKIYAQWIINASDAMSRSGYRYTPTILLDGEEVPQDEILDKIK